MHQHRQAAPGRGAVEGGPVDGGPVDGGAWREHRVRLSDTTVVARQRPGRGPAVVFEAGLGLPGSTWRPVCAHLPADRALLCYDRAGLSRSERGTPPRSGTRQLRELRELLRALGLPPPYVLVGHSAGAFIVRLHALEYPDEVAAVVLVDPAHEGERAARRRALRLLDDLSSGLVRAASVLARVGALAVVWRFARRAPLLRRVTRGRRGDLLAELISPRHLAGMADEDRAFATTVAEIRQAQQQRAMPDVHLRVITAEGSYRGWTLLPRSRRRERDRIRALHGALAAASPRGEHILAPHSGHLVMHDDPQLVAAAISAVL